MADGGRAVARPPDRRSRCSPAAEVIAIISFTGHFADPEMLYGLSWPTDTVFL